MGGSGALRAMELPAQSPEVTEQMSGAGLRRRGNTGTSRESHAPTCSALPGANSQGQDGLPGACCREACSPARGLLHLGFWRGSEADIWCLGVQRRCDRVAAAGQRQLALRPLQQHQCPRGWAAVRSPCFRVRVSAPNTAAVGSLLGGTAGVLRSGTQPRGSRALVSRRRQSPSGRDLSGSGGSSMRLGSALQ